MSSGCRLTMHVSRMRLARLVGMRMEPETRPDNERKLRRFISGMAGDDRKGGMRAAELLGSDPVDGSAAVEYLDSLGGPPPRGRGSSGWSQCDTLLIGSMEGTQGEPKVTSV